jgi:endonuclease V-like protein UPF0215 family
MRRLHLEKKGIRGLSIAESFRHDSQKSVLAGVITSSDLVIDGFVLGDATIKGDDATDKIILMYQKLDRNDISYLMTSGLVISLYNMVDVKKISDTLDIPVIGVTYSDSGTLNETIKNYFPDDYEEKLAQYKKIGDREKVSLKTGNDLFVRYEGCTLTQCKQLLDRITPSGQTPEPLRIAQLLAKTILTN